jgi:putative membrane protein
MKSIIKLFLPFLALIFLFACGGHRDENQYDTNAAEMAENPGDVKRHSAETNEAAAKRSPAENIDPLKAHPGEKEIKGEKKEIKSSFALKASEANQGEVSLGEMAIAKTKNKNIGAFATMMIKDHRTANGELMELAKEKGIDLPTACLPCEADYKNLHDMNTEEFEQQYAKKMVDDHEKAVKLFTEASQNETDPDLKKWASEKVPTLKHHLAMAKQLAKEENVSAKKKEKKRDRKTARS